jgi:hypothetical protein
MSVLGAKINTMTVAITMKETFEHNANEIGIKVSVGREWQEYHGDGENEPRSNDDSPMSRTWICELKSDIPEKISFCFYNFHVKKCETFEEEIIKEKRKQSILKLRKYNDEKPDKLDDTEEITIDYWIKK